jgi:hypothetical protein
VTGGAKVLYLRDQELAAFEVGLSEVRELLSIYEESEKSDFILKDQESMKEDVRHAIRLMSR